jgi:hypothetical protein
MYENRMIKPIKNNKKGDEKVIEGYDQSTLCTYMEKHNEFNPFVQ